MLIDEIIEFCDKQYREHSCMDCKNETKCTGQSKNTKQISGRLVSRKRYAGCKTRIR